MSIAMSLIGPRALLAPAEAAGGTARLSARETVEIAAAPDVVWGVIGDFQDMSWHPAVFSSTGEGGNALGAERVLTLAAADGPTITEVLDDHSDASRSYAYRITAVDVNVLPVTSYSSRLTVKPGAGGGTLIEWEGAFDRGHPGDDPPEKLNDAAAIAAASGVYRGGLDALKAKLEGEM